jgi:hypothetical protein
MQGVRARVTMEEVPIQCFHSVIAIELGVAGALLWEIGFFVHHRSAVRLAGR